MPLDGITSKFLSKELSESLTGARIEKIFQKNQHDIYLRLRNNNSNFQIIISANPSNPRIHITTEQFENPFIPLRFCSILRKYLTGGRITSVFTKDYERIFYIDIQTVNEIGDYSTKRLVVEIMGRYSNVIFLNEDGIILDAAMHVDDTTSRVREILPARRYVSPPSQNKLLPEDALMMLNSGTFFESSEGIPDNISVDKFILNSVVGFSPLFAREICHNSGVLPQTLVNSLSKNELVALTDILKGYMSKTINNEYSPCVFYESNSSLTPFDFHAFLLPSFTHYELKSSISEAMDQFFLHRSTQNDLQQKKSYLLKFVNQKHSTLSKKIIIHQTDLDDCKNMDIYKKYGDLILSNIHLITGNESQITVDDYYSDPYSSISIPMKTTLTPSRNAQEYYRTYRKKKSKQLSVAAFLEKELNEQNYLQSIIVAINNADSATDLEEIKEELNKIGLSSTQVFNNAKVDKKPKAKSLKNPPPLNPRKFESSDGYEILVGRNNFQNDRLTLKSSQKDDYWFHIQKAPGTHVILRTNKTTPPETSIQEAAMLAAWYSRNDSSGVSGYKVTVDYCQVKNVWKPKDSAPGHVLYENFNSIFVETKMPENIKKMF
jgi:predicted ribosome quality control (RQC) complex YloA/Tae2 family protein